MSTEHKTYAQKMAEWIESDMSCDEFKCAAELHRLDSENARLREQVKMFEELEKTILDLHKQMSALGLECERLKNQLKGA